MIRVLFRADAYPAIGTGDLMSLLHFSRHPLVMAEGWECHFMVRDHAAARSILTRRQVEHVALIGAHATMAEEIKAVARYTAAHGIDAVLFEITDRRLDTFDLTGIDAVMGAVDFYGWAPPGLDLVVNWDTEAQGRYDLRDRGNTAFFLGPEYVFLAPEFLCNAFRWEPQKNDLRPVVVTMGGGDEFDLTGRILSQLINRMPTQTTLTAIVGAGYDHMTVLSILAEGTLGRLTVKRDVTDMATEFIGARHVFAAGGLTAYELVATGTPCTLVACYDHQVHRCHTFADKGWANYLGHRRDFDTVGLPASNRQGADTSCPCVPFVSALDRVVEALETKVKLRRGSTPSRVPSKEESNS